MGNISSCIGREFHTPYYVSTLEEDPWYGSKVSEPDLSPKHMSPVKTPVTKSRDNDMKNIPTGHPEEDTCCAPTAAGENDFEVESSTQEQKTTPQINIYKYRETGSTLQDTCGMCFIAITSMQCIVLPRCGHIYHTHCVERLDHKKPQCTVCGTRISKEYGGIDLVPFETIKGYNTETVKRLISGRYAAKGLW